MKEFYENLLKKGDEGGDGAADSGAQDRGHYFTCVGERRAVRRLVCEVTSCLTRGLQEKDEFYSASFLSGCELGFEGKYPGWVRRRAPLAPSLTGHRMLLRITHESHSAAD